MKNITTVFTTSFKFKRLPYKSAHSKMKIGCGKSPGCYKHRYSSKVVNHRLLARYLTSCWKPFDIRAKLTNDVWKLDNLLAHKIRIILSVMIETSRLKWGEILEREEVVRFGENMQNRLTQVGQMVLIWDAKKLTINALCRIGKDS